MATAALQAIKQLRQAFIDVQLLPEALGDFHKDLQQLHDKFLPLSKLRLRTDAAQAAVQELLARVEDVTSKMKPQLEQLKQHPRSRPRWLARMQQALCICLAGPPKLQRHLEHWQHSVKSALDAVEKEKDDLLPRVPLGLFESLPHPCVTNSTVLSQLIAAVHGAEGGVVQLLGMGGMGKSVLALQAALQLEQGMAG